MSFRTKLLPLCLGIALVAAAPLAHAANDQTGSNGSNTKAQSGGHGGTLKGAAIGGLAGHEMGGHTKTGAAAGAVIGHHEKAKSKSGQNPG